jgi:hypothetical protein
MYSFAMAEPAAMHNASAERVSNAFFIIQIPKNQYERLWRRIIVTGKRKTH